MEQCKIVNSPALPEHVKQDMKGVSEALRQEDTVKEENEETASPQEEGAEESSYDLSGMCGAGLTHGVVEAARAAQSLPTVLFDRHLRRRAYAHHYLQSSNVVYVFCFASLACVQLRWLIAAMGLVFGCSGLCYCYGVWYISYGQKSIFMEK